MTKTPPALKPDEIKFKLNIEVPNDIFERPILESKIEIPIDSDFDKMIQQYEFELKQLKKD